MGGGGGSKILKKDQTSFKDAPFPDISRKLGLIKFNAFCFPNFWHTCT